MTTVQYTKQWVRIAGALRPVNYLLAIGTTATLLGVALLVLGHSFLLALEIFFLTLVLASAFTAVIWRHAAHTEINLGTGTLRSGKHTVPFAAVDSLALHMGNLLVSAGEIRILLPIAWLSRDQLVVVERMLGMLLPDQVPAAQLGPARGHLLVLLAA